MKEMFIGEGWQVPLAAHVIQTPCGGEMASSLFILYMVLPSGIQGTFVGHLFLLFSAGSKQPCPCTSLSSADRGLTDNCVESGVSRFTMHDMCQWSVYMTAECVLDHTQIQCAWTCS